LTIQQTILQHIAITYKFNYTNATFIRYFSTGDMEQPCKSSNVSSILPSNMMFLTTCLADTHPSSSHQ